MSGFGARGFNRLLKKWDSCFDKHVLSKVEGLSTNGKSLTFSSVPSFALSPSKGGRRGFQQPVGFNASYAQFRSEASFYSLLIFTWLATNNTHCLARIYTGE